MVVRGKILNWKRTKHRKYLINLNVEVMQSKIMDAWLKVETLRQKLTDSRVPKFR